MSPSVIQKATSAGFPKHQAAIRNLEIQYGASQ